MLQSFPSTIHKQLGFYVYRLIDPRNGETFYIGKGRGDRVFAHVKDELAISADAAEDAEDELSAKLDRIRVIRAEGFEVVHVIQRHGLDEATAFEVESALIDAFPGLANLQGGQGGERGAMHAAAIVRKYDAKPAVLQHKVILIIVRRRTVEAKGLSLATRLAWRVSKKRAELAELVLPVVDGLIATAYRPSDWRAATPDNFPGLVVEAEPGRFGFDVKEAEPEVVARYAGKRIPKELETAPGSQNPIRYSYPPS